MEDIKVIKKHDKIIAGIFFLIVSVFLAISAICMLTYKKAEQKNVNAFVWPSGYEATWTGFIWNKRINSGSYIWSVVSQGSTYYYYSVDSTQYYFDSSTNSWQNMTWTGLTSFGGSNIWTDGVDYYYSYNNNHYVLDVSNHSWSAMTWTGLTTFTGDKIWSDGVDYYYSNSTTQYVLDVSNHSWSAMTWTGLTNFNGLRIWTDGVDYYYSNNTSHYVLDVSNHSWSAMTWFGLTSFFGYNVWTANGYIFETSAGVSYILDTDTSTWSLFNFNFVDLNNVSGFAGSMVYFVGNNYYYATGSIDGSNTFTMKLTISNIGGGDDTPVYNFAGATVNIPFSVGYQRVSLPGTYSPYVVSDNALTMNFTTDNDDNFVIQFSSAYLRSYADANALSGSSTEVSVFTLFDTSLSNITSNSSNNFVFDLADAGQTFSFYGVDSTIYQTSSFTGGYNNVARFSIEISEDFEDFNFIGVRFYTDYTTNGNNYLIWNHVRYFDVDENYIDIALYLQTTDSSYLNMFGGRYYYFSNALSGGGATSEQLEQAYDDGYADGLQDGSSQGQSTGYTSGYNDGYSIGYQDATDIVGQSQYNSGYSVGYTAGVNATNNYTFLALISAVIDAPVSYFRSLFNFNLLGVNLLSFLTALFTLAIILFIVKKVV